MPNSLLEPVRMNTEWKNRAKEDRDFHIYEIVGQPGMWRIRLHLYPEHSLGGFWWGGHILWGFDQPDKSKAESIAKTWVDKGTFPERNDMSSGPRGRTGRAFHQFMEDSAKRREWKLYEKE